MPTIDEIKADIRSFLAENIPAEKTVLDETPLISSRMMDSIVALKLVSHLEEKFNIEFEAHEVDPDNLDTINIIAGFVQNKMK
jgi:methoxymalonate biosynthesis acyl carrier protein